MEKNSNLYGMVMEIWNNDMTLRIDGNKLWWSKFGWLIAPCAKLQHQFPTGLEDKDAGLFAINNYKVSGFVNS